MRTRIHTLESDGTLNDSQTKTIDLKGLDIISALEIIYQATNGATSNQGVPLLKDVDKIEIVDGSDVLWSLSGVEIAALNFFETKKYPYHYITEAAAGVQREKYTIHFGRKIGDPLYHFNPANYNNPQLKLTHSLTISATAGFATGTGRLTAIAHLFDTAPPAAQGYFMTKSHHAWTTVASGDETIKLPTDYPYRLMLVRGYESGIGFDTDITKLKLGLNEDKIVLFELNTDDLLALQENWFGLAEINQRLLRTDADAPESFLAVVKDAHVNAVADLDIASIDAITVDQLTLQLLSLTATPTIAKSSTDTRIELTAKGVAPHHTVGIPFGHLEDPETWLHAPDFEVIKLKATQGGAGAVASVILQQIRR